MTMWVVLSCKIDSARHIFVFNKLHRLPSFDIDKHASQQTAENNRNKVDLFYHLSLKRRDDSFIVWTGLFLVGGIDREHDRNRWSVSKFVGNDRETDTFLED